MSQIFANTFSPQGKMKLILMRDTNFFQPGLKLKISHWDEISCVMVLLFDLFTCRLKYVSPVIFQLCF